MCMYGLQLVNMQVPVRCGIDYLPRRWRDFQLAWAKRSRAASKEA